MQADILILEPLLVCAKAKGPSEWTALCCAAGSENSDQVRSAALESRSLSSHRNRAQHLLANFLVLLGFRAAGWQSDFEQLLNGLDIMHAQALKLLRRQVFLNVLAIIGRQNNICH